MKNTGIVRNVDNLGRIVLPVELRKTFNIKEGDPLEIYVAGDKIVLKKYNCECIFCGEPANEKFLDRPICSKCLEGIKVKCQRRQREKAE